MSRESRSPTPSVHSENSFSASYSESENSRLIHSEESESGTISYSDSESDGSLFTDEEDGEQKEKETSQPKADETAEGKRVEDTPQSTKKSTSEGIGASKGKVSTNTLSTRYSSQEGEEGSEAESTDATTASSSLFDSDRSDDEIGDEELEKDLQFATHSRTVSNVADLSDRPLVLQYSINYQVPDVTEEEEDRLALERRLRRHEHTKSEQFVDAVEKNDWDDMRKILNKTEQDVNAMLFVSKDHDTDKKDVLDINYKNDALGETGLHIAARKGYYRFVQYLLQFQLESDDGRGLLVNIQDNYGYTPLMLAAKNGKYKICETLLNHRAQPYVSDFEGWTPLHFAAEQGHWNIAKLLVDYKADVSAATKTGETSLMKACVNGHLPVVRYLFNSTDLHLDTPNTSGNTALHLAALFGQPHIIRYLVLAGADTNKKNKDRLRPCDIIPSNFALSHYRQSDWLLPQHAEEKKQRDGDQGDTPVVNVYLQRKKRHSLMDIGRLGLTENMYEKAAFTPRSKKSKDESKLKSNMFNLSSGDDKSEKRSRRNKNKDDIPPYVYPPAVLPKRENDAKELLQSLLQYVMYIFKQERERGVEFEPSDPRETHSLTEGDTPAVPEEEGPDASYDDEEEKGDVSNWILPKEEDFKFLTSLISGKEYVNLERKWKAYKLWSYGDKEMENGEFEVAMKLYESALRLRPYHSIYRKAFNAAAHQYNRLKLEDFQLKQEEERQHSLQAEVRFATGNKYFKQRNFAEAAKWYKAAAMQDTKEDRYKKAFEDARKMWMVSKGAGDTVEKKVEKKKKEEEDDCLIM